VGAVVGVDAGVVVPPVEDGAAEVVAVSTPFACDGDVLEAFNPPTTPPMMMATMATNATIIMMIPLLVR
jgi:hypothetical protein